MDGVIDLVERIHRAKGKKAIKTLTQDFDSYIIQGLGWGVDIKAEGAREAVQMAYDYAMERRKAVIPPYDTQAVETVLDDYKGRVRRLYGNGDEALPVEKFPYPERSIAQTLGHMVDYMRNPAMFGLYEQTQFLTIRQELRHDFGLIRKWLKQAYDATGWLDQLQAQVNLVIADAKETK